MFLTLFLLIVGWAMCVCLCAIYRVLRHPPMEAMEFEASGGQGSIEPSLQAREDTTVKIKLHADADVDRAKAFSKKLSKANSAQLSQFLKEIHRNDSFAHVARQNSTRIGYSLALDDMQYANLEEEIAEEVKPSDEDRGPISSLVRSASMKSKSNSFARSASSLKTWSFDRINTPRSGRQEHDVKESPRNPKSDPASHLDEIYEEPTMCTMYEMSTAQSPARDEMQPRV
jgi:hypothetical protein